MLKTPLFLAKHAFVCQANEHLVFLDLRQNKYFCLGRQHSLAIRPLLKGCGGIEESVVRSIVPDRSEARILHALVEGGLFVLDEASGKKAVLVSTEPPSTGVMIRGHAPPAAVNFQHVRNFFSATLLASIRLRCGSIEQTVRHVERRKRDAKRNSIDRCPLVGEQAAVFRALRRYYPRDYLCLFDSLALVEFLARYGVFPQWVFGVKLEPFGAHCWVQDGSTILNDTVEMVRKYTPIMFI